MNKIFLIFTAMLITLTACGDVDSTTKTIRIGSVVAENHPSNQSLLYFAKLIEEKTEGRFKFELFPNSVLGSEREQMEQLQQGVIEIVKGGQILGSFHNAYNIIGLPYIFESDEHFYKSLEDPEFTQKIFYDSADKGFITLSYLDKGARSFYTKDKPIITPDDLKGLKIRAINEPISMRVVDILGGSAVPMAYSEVYTALQQGVIDGAESDETVLNIGKHGEVTKAFSWDRHQRIPDYITVSTKFWDTLSNADKKIFQDAANAARDHQKGLWKDSIAEAVAEAKEMGVKFYQAEEKLFREKATPIIEEQKIKSAENKELIEMIQSLV